jgi:hypothetical protein
MLRNVTTKHLTGMRPHRQNTARIGRRDQFPKIHFNAAAHCHPLKQEFDYSMMLSTANRATSIMPKQ